MATDPKQQRFAVFLGCLVVVGIIIYALFQYTIGARFPRAAAPSEPVTFAPAQPAPHISSPTKPAFVAPASAPDERARYIERYLNELPTRQPGNRVVACVVGNDDGTLNHAVNAALVSRFSGTGTKILGTLFKPEFVSDGLLKQTFNGSTEPIGKLNLARSLDTLVVARQQVQFSANPNLENVLTANIQLEVLAQSLSGTTAPRTWKFTASGAGFAESDARLQAEERILKQITSATNLSLNTIPATNPGN